MLIAKCPLRVSLFGGSTDLESFVKTYGKGSVISFPSSLYVYITLHKNNRNKFIVNYTSSEEVSFANEIKNDLVREVCEHFYGTSLLPNITLTFNSDIQSVGSGLAASSAFMICLIKVVSSFEQINLSDIDVCNLSITLERNINPLTGYQDSYGCGISNFKKIDFINEKRLPVFYYYDSSFLNQFNMNLIYTNVNRVSTNILKTVDIAKSHDLLPIVDEANDVIENNNTMKFLQLVNDSWEIKKKTSSEIVTEEISLLEKNIVSSYKDVALKLCGAGAGGYFLTISKKIDSKFVKHIKQFNPIPINVDDQGISLVKI